MLRSDPQKTNIRGQMPLTSARNYKYSGVEAIVRLLKDAEAAAGCGEFPR